MQQADIETKVRAVFAEISDGVEIPDAQSDLTDLGFDSLTKVEAITRFEDVFGITFRESDINGVNFVTLASTVRLIESRLA